MKAKNKYLEKSLSEISEGLYEEAVEHALAGIKQTKNNKKTPRLNKMFTRILSCAAMGLNGGIEPAMEGNSVKCSFCRKKEDEVKIIGGGSGAFFCIECAKRALEAFTDNKC